MSSALSTSRFGRDLNKTAEEGEWGLRFMAVLAIASPLVCHHVTSFTQFAAYPLGRAPVPIARSIASRTAPRGTAK